MKISILTMFPEMLDGMMKAPIVDHAVKKGIVEIEIVDIKNFAHGSFRDIDDSPYGGGAGMILRAQPVLDAVHSVRKMDSHVIITAAAGTPFQQRKAHAYAGLDHLIILCGHYEGMDARIYQEADELISMGDYIVSGGEYPAMIITDAVVRLLDGVIKKESTEDESFENGLLEYPQYTRPLEYDGMRVPEVLLSGDHEKIRRYRRKESLRMTMKYRPDLIGKIELNEEDQELIKEIEYEALHG